jgi:hypothetical protein
VGNLLKNKEGYRGKALKMMEAILDETKRMHEMILVIG